MQVLEARIPERENCEPGEMTLGENLCAHVEWKLFEWAAQLIDYLSIKIFLRDKFEDIIDKWYLGDVRQGISPLVSLKKDEFGSFGANNRRRYNECKRLMDEVEKVGRICDAWKINDEQWTVQSVSRLKDAIRPEFSFSARSFQNSWLTMYRKVPKRNVERASRSSSSK